VGKKGKEKPVESAPKRGVERTEKTELIKKRGAKEEGGRSLRGMPGPANPVWIMRNAKKDCNVFSVRVILLMPEVCVNMYHQM